MSSSAGERRFDDVSFRHRCVPHRTFGSTVIVARPSDGTALVFEAAAEVVWRQLDAWTSPAEIDRRLAASFSSVPIEERVAALREILERLQGDDLLERR